MLQHRLIYPPDQSQMWLRNQFLLDHLCQLNLIKHKISRLKETIHSQTKLYMKTYLHFWVQVILIIRVHISTGVRFKKNRPKLKKLGWITRLRPHMMKQMTSTLRLPSYTSSFVWLSYFSSVWACLKNVRNILLKSILTWKSV